MVTDGSAINMSFIGLYTDDVKTWGGMMEKEMEKKLRSIVYMARLSPKP